jgi:hypothetical protein
LCQINHDEADVIFSCCFQQIFSKQSENVGHPCKKKSNGVLKHSAHTLKRVACLSSKDRKEALQIWKRQSMKRKGRNYSQSSKVEGNVLAATSSINKDWKNWVILHGNSEVAVEDVRGIGNVIGVKFYGDKANRFNVLSMVGRKQLWQSVKVDEVVGEAKGSVRQVDGCWLLVFVIRWGCRELLMKIISYNVRGLGCFEKRSEVCRLVR